MRSQGLRTLWGVCVHVFLPMVTAVSSRPFPDTSASPQTPSLCTATRRPALMDDDDAL